MKKANYHTHHYRCKHAEGEIQEYIEVAISEGLEELGMSCHVPYRDGRLYEDRMNHSDLNAYIKEIEELNKKYPSITVLKSLECEYYSELHDYYVELSKITDYLILGHHFIVDTDDNIIDMFLAESKEELNFYKEAVVQGVNTGLFSILAHPDLFMNNYSKWDSHCENITKEILDACIKKEVIIEYNANGLRLNRNYPNEDFWKYVAKHYKDIPVIVNSDAHSPKNIYDDFVVQAIEKVKELKLNLI